MAKAKGEKEFFIGIKKPKTLRRGMLETLRDTISLLQKSERMKKARAERYEAVSELRTIMNDIAIDLARLEQKLPRYTFEKLKVEEVEKKKKKKKKPRVREEEIDLLERELAEVEAKLKML